MPHGITQCYLPPGGGDIRAVWRGVVDRGERRAPAGRLGEDDRVQRSSLARPAPAHGVQDRRAQRVSAGRARPGRQRSDVDGGRRLPVRSVVARVAARRRRRPRPRLVARRHVRPAGARLHLPAGRRGQHSPHCLSPTLPSMHVFLFFSVFLFLHFTVVGSVR